MANLNGFVEAINDGVLPRPTPRWGNKKYTRRECHQRRKDLALESRLERRQKMVNAINRQFEYISSISSSIEDIFFTTHPISRLINKNRC